jgi:hypothetical protein
MRVKKRAIRELFGALHDPKRSTIPLEDMRCR